MTDEGEYSFLLHAIEGRLAAQIASPTALAASSSSSSSKRPRLSYGSVGSGASPSAPVSSSSYQNTPAGGGFTSSADRLNLLAEADQCRLLNEQLREKMKATEDEFARYKEKSNKQLAFLESENNQLRKEGRDRADQYYEEKQKLQARARDVEMKLADAEAARRSVSARLDAVEKASKSTKSSSASELESGSSASSSSSAANASTEATWEIRLLEMERLMKQRAQDIKSLGKVNAELEETCNGLKRELTLAHAKLGENAQAEDDAVETRDVKKRCGDLEVSLRRKTRELCRLEQKVQNQSLMEQELASANVKLKLAQDALEVGKNIQASYTSLVEERKEWVVLFQGIVTEQLGYDGGRIHGSSSSGSSGSNGSGGVMKKKSILSSSEISPAMVLRTLSSTQKQCAVLLKSQGALESTVTEVGKQLAMATSQLAAATKEKDDKALQVDRLTAVVGLAQQQSRLYEGEVTSLRALLQSFDAEFKIGRRPGEAGSFDVQLKKKDELIGMLRKELDGCRKEAQGLVARCEQQLLEQAAAAASSSGVGADTLAGALKTSQAREQALRDDLRALQVFSGADFVPGNTRVLHMTDNPCRAALGARAQPAVSSLPREQLKHAKSQVRELHAQVSALAAREQEEEQGPGADVSMNMSAAPRGAPVPSAAAVAAAAADSNKLNQRLKEMFKERITAFREAVYLLTGYKVDLYAPDASTGGQARLRLRSMYAENPDDSLLFQWKGETLELMETPFAGKLDPKLFAYLSSCNSVPSFLSNVTLELFDNQTFISP